MLLWLVFSWSWILCQKKISLSLQRNKWWQCRRWNPNVQVSVFFIGKIFPFHLKGAHVNACCFSDLEKELEVLRSPSDDTVIQVCATWEAFICYFKNKSTNVNNNDSYKIILTRYIYINITNIKSVRCCKTVVLSWSIRRSVI